MASDEETLRVLNLEINRSEMRAMAIISPACWRQSWRLCGRDG